MPGSSMTISKVMSNHDMAGAERLAQDHLVKLLGTQRCEAAIKSLHTEVGDAHGARQPKLKPAIEEPPDAPLWRKKLCWVRIKGHQDNSV
jgi:hypothetical protein